MELLGHLPEDVLLFTVQLAACFKPANSGSDLALGLEALSWTPKPPRRWLEFIALFTFGELTRVN